MTPRQRAVADLVCRDDLSYQEASIYLGIARSTFYAHVKAIIARFGVQSMRTVCYRYRDVPPRDLAVDGARAGDV